MITWEQWVQGIVAVFVIASPPDPVKVLVFNDIVRRDGLNRTAAASKVAFYFIVILGVSALIGQQLLELLGINLDAFSVVGGSIIALMGFEMLYGGAPSRAQGKEQYDAERDEGTGASDGLILPLSTPLLAGPGAIATVITIAAVEKSGEATLVALDGGGVTGLAVFLSMAFLGGAIAKLSPRGTALLARLGGVLLATIGVQMALGGLKNFFAS